MTTVKFKEVSSSDSNDYIFASDDGKTFHIYTDNRSRYLKGTDKDFWDKFYSCQSINIDYTTEDDVNIILKVNSYK